MRRLLVISVLFAALAAPAAAFAGRVAPAESRFSTTDTRPATTTVSRTTPSGPRVVVADGTASLVGANGTFTISGRGAVIGQIDKGSVKIADPVATDGSGPIVSGAEHERPVSDTTSRYSGTDVDFRIIGGTFTIVVSGTGVDLSFVGRGKITLTGDPKAIDDGTYSLDGGLTYAPVVTAVSTFAIGAAATSTAPTGPATP